MMTPQEQAALLRLARAVQKERQSVGAAVATGMGPEAVEAVADVSEALADWEALRFSPRGAELRFPSDPDYRPGDGPCPACGEPGEGARCACTTPVSLQVLAPQLCVVHLSRTGAVLMPVIPDPDLPPDGYRCSRDRCPQYLLQPSLPGTGDDTARAFCAASGQAPGLYCEPRALDLVEMMHRRTKCTS